MVSTVGTVVTAEARPCWFGRCVCRSLGQAWVPFLTYEVQTELDPPEPPTRTVTDNGRKDQISKEDGISERRLTYMIWLWILCASHEARALATGKGAHTTVSAPSDLGGFFSKLLPQAG